MDQNQSMGLNLSLDIREKETDRQAEQQPLEDGELESK